MDFSSGGKLSVRVRAASQDALLMTDATAATALKMGGTSAITVDMAGYLSTDPNGNYVVGIAPSWSVGQKFTTVTFLNNTSGKISLIVVLAAISSTC